MPRLGLPPVSRLEGYGWDRRADWHDRWWQIWRQAWIDRDPEAVQWLKEVLYDFYGVNNFRQAMLEMRRDKVYRQWFYGYYGVYPYHSFRHPQFNRDGYRMDLYLSRARGNRLTR